MKKALFVIFVVLLIDQISKIYLKTHFVIEERIKAFGLEWFQIYFVQNNGMAWGTEIGGETGKFLLTIFRLFAVVGIFYWLIQTVKKHKNQLMIFSIALIFAGAMGNIIDSVFYGVIFDDPIGKTATLFSDQPYGKLLHGKVVDMFYFPLWNGHFPDWFPIIGGDSFTFFNAIFNVADASITIGVVILIFFNKTIFPKEEEVDTMVYID